MRNALVTLGLLCAPALGGPADGAGERISAMLAGLDALSDQAALPDAEIAARFAGIAKASFNRPAMARAALGTASDRLTRDQWAAFLAAYSAHLERAFLRGVREAGASSSSVLASRRGADGVTVVVSRVTSAGREHDVLWFMCPDDRQRVCDVEIDGIRASTHQRADFADRMRAEGLDGLIRALAAGWPGGGG